MFKTEKSPKLVDQQMRFYSACPAANRPSNIGVESATAYHYDFVEGRHPVTSGEFELAYRAMRPNWDAVVYGGQDRYVLTEAYKTYITQLQSGAGIDLSFLDSIPSALPKVVNPHGDLTANNILIKGNSVVFIDPSLPRSLPCKEMDESKLLQSMLTQWDYVKHSRLAKFALPPFDVTDVHLSLLLTHWLRLLNHKDKHKEQFSLITKFAKQSVFPIILEMMRDEDPNRYRRGFDKLQARCL